MGKDDQRKTLLELIEYHNTNMTSVLKAGTLKNYYTTEKYLNKFLVQNIKLKWLVKNPFGQFQLKSNKYDRQNLSERELELIENTYFNSERLEQVKDIFIFSCYKGLSYIDVKQLTIHQIVKGIDNNYWIYTKREKTNEVVKIPILPKALDIIDKYKVISKRIGSEMLLPLYSNQKTNSY